jgi:uncharacterized membrane protein
MAKRGVVQAALAGDVDFDDEDSVLLEMSRELDVDPDDLSIDDEGRGFSSFGTDTFWYVEMGKQGYVVARDDDAVEQLAIAVVTQDLESEPEIFSQDFLESHINVSRLRRDLESDTQSSNYDYYNDMGDDDLIREAESDSDLVQYLTENEDEEYEIDDRDGLVEALAEQKTEADLKDPVAYLQEMLGDADGIKEAIKIAGIDIEAAAQKAVNVDGAGHFLSSYDGEIRETKSGLPYWRTD